MVVSGKGGLGRGLTALIPGNGQGVAEIPVTDVRPNPRQPRHRVDPSDLAELVASIKEHGVIQPVVVTRSKEDGGYVLIAGERRWTAAVQAGLDRIPAVVKDVSPQEMLELALVENVQRSDLNPLEEANAYHQLVTDFGLTQEQVAQRVGRNRSTIANSIRLLALPDVVQSALAKGDLSEGHARALLGASNAAEILALFQEVIDGQFTVRQTEDLVRRRRTSPVSPIGVEDAADDPSLREIERLFREALGTRVEVSRAKAGGRLVIHYYNDEQLQAIYELLTRA